MNKDYYIFTEHNDNEGETWQFFIKGTPKTIDNLRDLISSDESYELSNEPKLTKEEAILLHNHANDTGYYASHTLVGEVKIKKNLDIDLLYKGGIIDFCISSNDLE